MFTVEVLPAQYGDALLVSYGPARSPHRILVDGGLGSVAPVVAERVRALDADIDLMIVTHVDLDHIGGAVRLLKDAAFTGRLGGIWFNGYPHLRQFSDVLGPIDGERLTRRIVELGLAWNAGWPWRLGPADDAPGAGGAVVVEGSPPRVPLPGGATAIVLSPTPTKLAELLPVWKQTIERAGLVAGVTATPDPAEPKPRVLLGAPTLTELAARRTPDDTAEANGSSIAIVLEYVERGTTRRVLLAGDAHPDALIASLDQLRGNDARYRVDACKLPHHGSRRNVSRALVQRLDCRQWIVSSNGVRFSHPNPEALARVIVDGGASPTIYGNYASGFLTDFASDYPPDEHGYRLVLPPDGETGITVDLARKR